MVLLTMTDAIVAAVKYCTTHENGLKPELDEDYPSLQAPAVGKPIAHTQLLAISKYLKETIVHTDDALIVNTLTPAHHLDSLLRGSKVYVEPPKPKAKPVSVAFAIL